MTKLRKLIHHLWLFAFYGSAGVFLTLVVVFVQLMNDRPDLSIWHFAELDEEFTVDSEVQSFEEYLALEDRLFKQLDDEVYAKITSDQKSIINRYNKGSLSDPGQWPQNWNRSYEMPVSQPKAAVLLLHGMSDSPYSLRNLAERLHQAGVYVVGLRIPGHGTAPSGLTTVSWQDMAAAVKLAVQHVAEKAGGQPLHIIGYSNGGALAVNYALAAADDATLPQMTSIALLSPEIGIAAVAALAVWQARLGTLLGLDKLAWNGILPEYDPYKYGSFAVNAGDVAHKLTGEIQQQITVLDKQGKLEKMPSILAFSSIVDATVSAPTLIKGLFDRLPEGGHELVLFNINQVADIGPLLKWSPAEMFGVLRENPGRTFTLSLVTNKSEDSMDVRFVSQPHGMDEAINIDLGLSWPKDVYSLTHVALPFPPDDPLYGAEGESRKSDFHIHLGDIALRGERGVLLVPASEMLRLRWNPFYPFLEQKVMEFFTLETPGKTAAVSDQQQ
jgi:alpha-beta hydrolase superfamily lysophospholipase